MATYIYVTSSFRALHRWKDAPEDVAFLRDYHRHLFGVKVSVRVTHKDRQVEFFQLQRKLDELLQAFEGHSSNNSCERFAQLIMDALKTHRINVVSVEVNEDGENGALILQSGGPQLTDDNASTETLLDVTSLVRMTPFIGIEAEGPLKGQPTLFLPGETSVTVVAKILEMIRTRDDAVMDYGAIEHVYYGAGNRNALELQTLLYLVRQAGKNNIYLTVENGFKWMDDVIEDVEEWNHTDLSANHFYNNVIWVSELGGKVTSHCAYSLERVYEKSLISEHHSGKARFIVWSEWHGLVGDEDIETPVDHPFFSLDKELELE